MQSPMIMCPVCKKVGGGRLPKGGDGTFYYPRRHNGPDGKPCEGNVCEGWWVPVDGSKAEEQ